MQVHKYTCILFCNIVYKYKYIVISTINQIRLNFVITCVQIQGKYVFLNINFRRTLLYVFIKCVSTYLVLIAWYCIITLRLKQFKT